MAPALSVDDALASAPNLGTTFTIDIPAKLVEHVAGDTTIKETTHV